jgi:SEC-C motif-containing protein
MPVSGPIDPRKVPRNAPCPCGSGKKFKKCCLRMLEGVAPLVRDHAEKARRAQFEAPSSVSTLFKGKRVRALGSKILFREPTETFHEFLIALLRATFGKKWHDEEAGSAPARRHVVWDWIQEWRDLGARSRPADHPADQPHSAPPTGPAQAVLSLAEDLYRVQQQLGKLPKRLRERLRLRDQFQGARYEAAIAATFIRCGFKLAWSRRVLL